MRRGFGIAAAALALTLSTAVAAEPDPHFPQLTGDVVDDAQILSAPAEATLTRELAQLRHRTGHRLVVATVGSLQGLAISDYGIRLFRSWQVGRKGEDDGVVLLIAPRERQVRIDVGYRLEPEVPWWAWAILLGFAAFMCGIFWIVFRAVRAALRSAHGARETAASMRARYGAPPADNAAGDPGRPFGTPPSAEEMQADFDRRWAENAARIEQGRAEALAGIEAARANPATRYTMSEPGAASAEVPEDQGQPAPPAPAADTSWVQPEPSPTADPTQWGWDPSPPPSAPDFGTAEPPSPPPSPPDDSNLYTGGSAGGGGAEDRW